MLTDSQRRDWLRLARTENIGPVTFRNLIARFGTASKALAEVPRMASRGGAKSFNLPDESSAAQEIEALVRLGGRMIAKKLVSSPVALLFGSEKFGLSNDDMSYCHWLMRIPSREEHASMNLGQAVALCLYEIIRSPAAAKAKPEAKQAAQAEELDRLTILLEEVLEHSGYVHARVEESTRLKTRRLIRRMNLNAHDAEVWLGMLRQVLWKLVS